MAVKKDMRPCTVRTKKGNSRASFHQFFVYQFTKSAILQGETSGQESRAMAIVEFDDGQVDIVNAYDVKFLDSERAFSDFITRAID